MSNQRSVTLVLQANEPEYIRVSGDFVHVRDASAAVSVGMDGATPVSYVQGETVQSSYERLEFLSATTQTVTFIVGPGEFRGNAVTATISAAVDVQLSDTAVSTTAVSVPATSSAQILASNVDRKEARVSLLSTAANEVYVGGSGIGAGEGGPIEPGVTDYISTTAALHAYNPGASPVTVYVMELEVA